MKKIWLIFLLISLQSLHALDKDASTDWRTNKEYTVRTLCLLQETLWNKKIKITNIQYNKQGCLKVSVMDTTCSYDCLINSSNNDLLLAHEEITNLFQSLRLYIHNVVGKWYPLLYNIKAPNGDIYTPVLIQPKESNGKLTKLYMHEETDIAVGAIRSPHWKNSLDGETVYYLFKTFRDVETKKIFLQPIIQIPELMDFGDIENAIALPGSNMLLVFNKSGTLKIIELTKRVPEKLLTFKQHYDVTCVYN